MSKLQLFKKVWCIAKAYKWYFLGSYVVLITELAFKQASPLFLGKLMDAAIYKHDINIFISTAIYYTIIFVGWQSSSYLQLKLWQILNNKYVYDLRVKCYKKVLYLQGKDMAIMKTGDVIQIINSDTMEFHHLFQRYAMRTINAGIGTITSIIIIASIRWEVALLVIVLILSSVLITNNIKNRLKMLAGEMRCKAGAYNAWLVEILAGIKEIKLFSAEKSVYKKFVLKNEELIAQNVKQTKLTYISNALIDGIFLLAQLSFYITSAIFVVNKAFTVAEYIAIAGYYTLISENFQAMLKNEMDFQKREVSIERVFELLEKEDEIKEELKEMVVSKGEIVISDLCFAYEENKNIISNFSCHILAGQKIGIVGQSGVGKSTLAHLLIKLFLPNEGTIFVDSQDIRDCSYKSIRKNIGVISQETVIFNMTVKQNICFDEEVPDEKIWNILEKVYLKSEIMLLPNGIHTMLGDNGISLSGGQSQRLAIARMLYRNPPIVVFDEATSALDQKTEAVVQKSLDELAKDRTSIIISHRFNSIRVTDRVIVLKEKNIVAEEHYNKLFQDNQFFRDLFLTQEKQVRQMLIN